MLTDDLKSKIRNAAIVYVKNNKGSADGFKYQWAMTVELYEAINRKPDDTRPYEMEYLKKSESQNKTSKTDIKESIFGGFLTWLVGIIAMPLVLFIAYYVFLCALFLLDGIGLIFGADMNLISAFTSSASDGNKTFWIIDIICSTLWTSFLIFKSIPETPSPSTVTTTSKNNYNLPTKAELKQFELIAGKEAEDWYDKWFGRNRRNHHDSDLSVIADNSDLQLNDKKQNKDGFEIFMKCFILALIPILIFVFSFICKEHKIEEKLSTTTENASKSVYAIKEKVRIQKSVNTEKKERPEKGRNDNK